MPFQLLSDLWLAEPGAGGLARGRALLRAPVDFDLPALAQAYADALVLNVYPYGSVFIDPAAELNGSGAEAATQRYARHDYQPAALGGVGAPDHLGLGLGLLGHLAALERERAFAEACGWLLGWAPAVCLAVQREPSAHAFYRSLAAYTAETLLLNAAHLQALSPPAPGTEDGHIALARAGADEEVRLRDVVRFLLAPARCGAFLSRGRLGHLGRDLGLALPFGSRESVAESLFSLAGLAGNVGGLIAALRSEIEAWAGAYGQWAAAYPAWAPVAQTWLARTNRALAQLDQMAQQL
jgi:hypothetical protein